MELKIEDLRTMYESMTVSELMARLELRSPGAFYRLLARAGIDRKRPDTSPRKKTNIKLVD